MGRALWWMVVVVGCGPGAANTGPGEVEVIAGDTAVGFSDGSLNQARFLSLTAMCVSPIDGAIYASDTFAGTIREIDLAGDRVRTVAGFPGEPGVADGVDGRLSGPRGLACLQDGALLVADDGALRRVQPDTGAVTTVAGQPGQPGYADGGVVEARMGYLIHAMVADPDGDTVWIADRSNDAIRAFELADGRVRTVADQGWQGPGGLVVDEAGDALWVADTFGERLRRVDRGTGAVTELDTGSLGAIQGVMWDGDGGLVVAGFSPLLQRVDPDDGGVSIVSQTFGGTFASPVLAADGMLYPDLDRGSLRVVDLATGEATHVAGPRQPFAERDGGLGDARFLGLAGIAASADGQRVYVADAQAVRVVDRAGGAVTTLPVDGLGTPGGLALDADGGVLYLADTEAGVIHALDLDASTSRVHADGLDAPWGLAFGDDGALYVAEHGGRRVSRVGDHGALTVLAGSGAAGGTDGVGAAASFRRPAGLAATDDGALLLADEAGCTIRRIELEDGAVSTLVGTHNACGDASGGSSALVRPVGVAAAAGGVVLIADEGAHTLRSWQAEVGLRDVAGSPGRAGGMGPGVVESLDRAALGYLQAVVVVGGEALVTADAQLLRVAPGEEHGPW